MATPRRSNRPPMKVGESTSARTWSRSRSSRWPAKPSFRASSYISFSSSSWCGSVATSISPLRSKSQSMPYAATAASIASRLRSPSSSSFASSPGQREMPLLRPWVREAAQNPPLRPEAAQPTSCPSISTTSRPGSRSLARSAVHSPLYPPPTTSRSQRSSPVRAGRGAGFSGSSSQNDTGFAPERDCAALRMATGAMVSNSFRTYWGCALFFRRLAMS